MAQTIVKMGEHEDRIVNIIKGKYGLKNKSEAINFVINKFGQELLEPSLKPEYLEKLDSIKKQSSTKFGSVEELRKYIKNS